MVIHNCGKIKGPDGGTVTNIASSSRTSIGSRLKRFGDVKEEPHRQASPGDLVAQLRAKREMLRQMTPEQARDIIEIIPRLNLIQAVELAERTGRLIVPNDIISKIPLAKLSIPTQSGTIVIYEAANKPFGNKITFKGLRVSIPKQFQGKVNCALLVEHPDFTIKHMRLTIPDKSKIHLVKDFPKTNGHYLVDLETGTPTGEQVGPQNDGSRYLLRLGSHYVGSVARYVNYFVDGRRNVYAYYFWSVVSGVALL